MKIINNLKRIKLGFTMFYLQYCGSLNKNKFAKVGKHVVLHPPLIITNPQNIYIEDNVNIFGFSNLIISENGKLIMKKNCGAAQGLTIVTGNHSTYPPIGKWFKEIIFDTSTDKDTTVTIEEDVWLGANVTILPGVTVGRCSVVGAGSVLRQSVPPYSIVLGNPAKVVSFKYTPEEIIEHEKVLFEEKVRLPLDLLEKNYKKYYLNKIKDINKFLK